MSNDNCKKSPQLSKMDRIQSPDFLFFSKVISPRAIPVKDVAFRLCLVLLRF
jgi:hypothetical protein